MFPGVSIFICPCKEISSAQQKIWKKAFSVTKEINEHTTHIVVGRRSITKAEVSQQAKANVDVAKYYCVHYDWIVESIKLKRIQLESHYVVNFENIITIPKRRRIESYVSQPSPLVTLGDEQIYAYGLGTLPWGVSYPDVTLRPEIELIWDIFAMAQRYVSPHQLYIDTADTYCSDQNDIGLVETICGSICNATNDIDQMSKSRAHAKLILNHSHPHVFIGTKGGMTRTGSESSGWRLANYTTVADWVSCIRNSVLRLGYGEGRSLPLWMVHHCAEDDSSWDIVLSACAQSIQEGLVKHIGLCNVSVMRFEYCVSRASSLGFRIVCIQQNYSLWNRAAEKSLPPNPSRRCEMGTLEMCREYGVPFLAYGALGGSSARNGSVSLESDFPDVVDMALLKGVSPHSLVLAYMRHRWPCIVHIVGARSLDHVEDYYRSVESVRFTETELLILDQL